MKLVDAGSTWCKIYDSRNDEVSILPTKEFLLGGIEIDWGTGHVARRRTSRYENDLVSLAKGSLALVEDDDFTVIDVGSRDTKFVTFRKRKPLKMDWSVGCATATGATVEMLSRFYDVDFQALDPQEEWIPVTCGTYALERIMDWIASGGTPGDGVARFIHGITRNVWNFAGKPSSVLLSGGFCENNSFVHHLGNYCDVRMMGRLIPLAGLWSFAAEAGEVPVELPGKLRV